MKKEHLKNKKIRRHLFIKGMVQGIGYRYFTKRQAVRLKVSGWVKNLDNGNVEAVFEGEEEKVKQMINYCRHGPPLARVDGMNIKKESCQQEKEFVILK